MMALGSEQYREDINRMAMAFFKASPYKDLGIEEKKVNALIDSFLMSDKNDKIILLWLVDAQPVGILAAMAEQNLFNTQRFAGELIWWIDPPHRRSKAAEEMRKAFEYWAKLVGCQSASLVDLMGNLKRYYTRKGYTAGETVYLKVF